MIYDQIQSGTGTKDDHMVPLGLLKNAVGPAIMMQNTLAENDEKVLACLYCGDGYYAKEPDVVVRKLVGMVKKIGVDGVICGPCFNYIGYGRMAAHVAHELAKAGIPAVVGMSPENEDTIKKYKNDIYIVKTPKKGDIGLDRSLQGMCEIIRALNDNKDITALKKLYCYE